MFHGWLFLTGTCILLLLFKAHCKEFDFIPDVVAIKPSSTLAVTYSGNLKVQDGNELTPTQVKSPPVVEWGPEDGAFYTLAMTDPDAPSREDPQFREVLHWLVVNIPGNDISSGQTLAEYIGSGPPQGTGLHRYVFLLFKQSQKLAFNETYISATTRTGRLSFSIQKFVEKYKILQPAVGGNHYQAQYDDYVPTLHKQMTN